MERQEFWLEIIRGKSRGQVFRLLADAITIGRRLAAKERKINWILLDEPSLSRIHAQLLWDNDDSTYRLVHKSRTKPTLVNNREIDEEFMATQDKIQMGDVLLRFWEGPIEKKFDYYEEEFDQDLPSSRTQGKPGFSALPPQKIDTVNALAESEETAGSLQGNVSPVRKGSAPVRQPLPAPLPVSVVKPSDRDALRKAGSSAGAFKPVDLFAPGQAREQVPLQEEQKKPRVFYSQNDELKSESAQFRPLKFDLLSSSDNEPEASGSKPPGASAPRRVDIIKDRTSRLPEQGNKGGRIFGVKDDEEALSAFAPLEFTSTMETQVMLKKPSTPAGDSSDFKPLNLTQQRQAADNDAAKVKGKILGILLHIDLQFPGKRKSHACEDQFPGQNRKNHVCKGLPFPRKLRLKALIC